MTKKINYNLILWLLIFRIVTDFIWYEKKPIWNVSVYILFTLIFIFGNFKSIIRIQKQLYILLFLFFPIASSFINSYFDNFFLSQMSANLKNYLPTIFLYVVSVSNVDFEKLRGQCKKLLLPIVLFGFLYLLFYYNVPFKRIYLFFYNEPNHVFSQTVSKIFFLYSSYIVFSTLFLFLVYLINVRSNIIPIFVTYVILLFKKEKKTISYIILSIICLVIIYDFNEIYDRLLFKGQSHTIERFSSGRNYLYLWYAKYMLSKFTFSNWLFGYAGIQFYVKEIVLGTHNDILTIISNYGIVGLIGFCVIYYNILKKIDPKYRNYIIFYFIFVSLTNGIMSHQSNIIFALYFKTSVKSNKEGRIAFLTS